MNNNIMVTGIGILLIRSKARGGVGDMIAFLILLYLSRPIDIIKKAKHMNPIDVILTDTLPKSEVPSS
jgi:hypothetical protein